MPSSDLPVGLTDQLKIEPATAQLGRRLSPAIKGAIGFVVANRVTLRIHIRRGG